MSENKTKQQMLQMLDIMLDENIAYGQRLEAYEFLLEDCDEIVDEMLKRSYSLDGDTGKMLMEVLARYKGNKAIFMGLVSYLYKGDDVALFAKLIGSYGDEQGIQVLKTFCDEYEPNYNEFMELRNAVEELGGDFDLKEDFSDDPLYRYLKGLDEKDDRTSPFEDLWKEQADEEDCDDGCDCHRHHAHGDDCGSHHHDCDDDCGGECCHHGARNCHEEHDCCHGHELRHGHKGGCGCRHHFED